MDSTCLAQKKKKGQENEHFFVIADKKLQDTEIGDELYELLDSLPIGFKFSSNTFDNSLLWISAKGNSEENKEKYTYDTELCMIYYNPA